ncbi:hypothetical protein [Mucilaginibacter sp. L3T2-6]|uniref:hypothetical protein n=1 Tax=Mucilaginibacter sp. L3T2-6 TaxID=3062491 RepID=UPI0026754108|nr:hypothetical protein [Mucilaginibacter sp. L3T2-6]MDO3641967.1 hypothetical protein [Mucilaginibacter sp. L3T2-6]MDV6214355.1 hypothetical protein [Mucilaginibacter sp. L3T2-6]
MSAALDKKAVVDWDKYVQELMRDTVVVRHDTEEDKQKALKDLEADPEKWMAEMFPNYAKCRLARFHRRAINRLIKNKRWFEVLMWARELAKSTITMMVVMYLALVPKELKNILLVSNSFDNAVRLLTPYRLNLQNNQRIQYYYGIQEKPGSWTDSEFVTRDGVSFRALGAGQSPRGTRNENYRVDCILIDDIDTDEECRNEKRVRDKFKWIQESLIPTVSVSGDYRIIVCGNKIAKVCTVSLMVPLAKHVDIVNIRDENGKSTWPEKNSEADIDYILSIISYESGQKEYFNNPHDAGDVFTQITYGKAPHPRTCRIVLAYADPATSNSDKKKKGTSFKSVLVIGIKDFTYYVYRVWLDQVNNSTFIGWLFEADNYMMANCGQPKKIYIENNTLQAPFYEQVFIPLIKQTAKERGRETLPPIMPDTRKKPEKYFRVEGTLEPIDRMGNLVFDESLKSNPHMEKMAAQMLGVAPDAETMDGPDCLEGGVYIIQHGTQADATNTTVSKPETRSTRR